MASFSFGSGNLAKLLSAPLYLAGRIATAVIPRARDRWVFGCANGVTDGALALWREVSEQPIRAVWMTASTSQDVAAAALGIRAVRKNSWRGFWHTARAGVTVVTHGFGDVNRYAATGGCIVQLWHGIPLKRIGLDSAETTRSPVAALSRWLSPLLAQLYRRTQSRIRLLPAASDEVAGRLRSAFGLPAAAVPVTGEPRTDVLSAGDASERRRAARDVLRALTGASETARLVLYAPTWRDGAEDPAVPSHDEWHEILRVLGEQDAVLLVRSHPLGAGTYNPPQQTDRVVSLGSGVVADVTPLLSGLDALITDYSSLIFDSALVPVPLVLLAPDVAEYGARRGFYGTYDEVSGGGEATTWHEAVAQLEAVLGDEAEAEQRRERARSLSARFHAFRDGNAARRVASRIAELTAG